MQVIDWIPVMKGKRLRDLPSFLRTTNPDDVLLTLGLVVSDVIHKASALVLFTFDALEQGVLTAPSSMPNIPPVYTIGPVELLLNQIPKDHLNFIGYSRWKEETECLPMAKLPWQKTQLFMGLIASWCPQEQVLNHASVGGFLRHGGWNSTIESLTAVVPMLCWPFFADRQTDCYYTCNEWGIGMEIDNDVKRDEVEKLIKELMEGENGKKMTNKAMEWKKLAQEATGSHDVRILLNYGCPLCNLLFCRRGALDGH
ncbi:hypothetical protein Prudu_009668 [Prunus dulcis]|uniref:UDP-Glycosyltransferase superfamily protein n=1 Tax=Prunus dulcis TaxID=3755 RepID=A0A4Y1R6Y8_PRUDU|nr:hypothetical protein Prudu_009668 [Prunus dulcis]